MRRLVVMLYRSLHEKSRQKAIDKAWNMGDEYANNHE